MKVEYKAASESVLIAYTATNIIFYSASINRCLAISAMECRADLGSYAVAYRETSWPNNGWAHTSRSSEKNTVNSANPSSSLQ